ncbi:MAG TPA: hypothetical protein VFE32_14420 [Puia sp.]|jgi:hypothetical protein|nr:hypothetical protein [Puia sp.]
MKTKFAILFTAGLLFAGIATQAQTPAHDRREIRSDRREIRHDRRNIRHDRRDVRFDRRDIRHDRRSF